MVALEEKLIINGVDVWTAYGVFLSEDKKGSLPNQKSLLAASKTKSHTAVNFHERNGAKYPQQLTVANEERDITLQFTQVHKTRAGWFAKYREFIQFLKSGGEEGHGWLNIQIPDIDMNLRVFYLEQTSLKPLTYIWQNRAQTCNYSIKFREPEPVL